MKKFSALTFLVALFITANVTAQDIVFGQWKTIDESGKAKSIVEIYEKDGKAFGKVVEIIDPDKQESTCEECDEDDPRKDQKILGMEIIKDMEKDGSEWDDGTILDPNNGKVYSSKMWLENGKLYVRGYIGFSLIGRTQVWEPVK